MACTVQYRRTLWPVPCTWMSYCTTLHYHIYQTEAWVGMGQTGLEIAPLIGHPIIARHNLIHIVSARPIKQAGMGNYTQVMELSQPNHRMYMYIA